MSFYGKHLISHQLKRKADDNKVTEKKKVGRAIIKKRESAKVDLLVHEKNQEVAITLIFYSYQQKGHSHSRDEHQRLSP